MSEDSISIVHDIDKRTITLKRFEARNVNYLLFGAYRLRVEVESAVGMDPNVFVYRRDLPNPKTGEITDTFFTVASPVDMEEYPTNQPDPVKAFPFFRLSVVELDIRAASLAEEAYHLIVQEVTILVHGLNQLEKLRVIDEVQIGPFPDDAEGIVTGD